MSFWKWSRTANNNAAADGSINWAEGQAPSSVNDSARAMMAAAAKYRDDIAGAIVTGGTSTAYTISTYQSFDTLAHMDGAMISFTPHTTNGASVTLNADGTGAKPLRPAPGIELATGTLVQGTPYVCTYNNSDAVFFLKNFFGSNPAFTPYLVPIGAMIPYVSSTAPNSNFALPYGQAISRSTYSALFAITSTTFGVGDGSTTFNLPDLRGRVVIGKDDMGGSAASRVTTAGSSIDGTTIGAAGGAQTVTLAQANLPNVTLTATGSISLNTDNVAGNHTTTSGNADIALRSSSANNYSLNSGATSSINGGVTQTAVNKMPPGIVLPLIMRII